MKARLWLIVLGVLVLVGVGIWFWQSRASASRSGVAVYVAAARQEQLARELEVSGTVEMEDINHVTARISAPVRQISVRVGQEVRAGQLLARLDVSDYQSEVDRYRAQVEQARAELAVARLGARPQEIASLEASRRQTNAALEQARLDWQRLEDLQKAGAVPPQQVEKSRLEVTRLQEELAKLDQQLDQARQGARPEEIRALEAKIEEAQAGLNRAEQQVAYGQVTSPIDGYILSKDIEPGQMLSPGMPMFTIGSREKLVVKAEVPEGNLWALQVGQQARISGDGLRGREYQGRILRIAPVAEENLLKNEQARYLVTLSLSQEKDEILRPGMNVKVHFLASSPNAVVIPADALVEREGDTGTETVWTVEGGRARRRTVRLGLKTEQLVEVVSGLKAGEEVILAPPPELTDDSPVRLLGRK
ncbi:MAG TPA: efflux RND transporter periplasmic adaptor subunit [Desulfotomaculum sp.]|nr:efflux RND transporter periplasmic adaptor subunit [Desulfotomaculum sp.]